MAKDAIESVDDLDFDDNFEESIPCSFSYVSICIFFPASTGMLGGILWSGYTLYVREMGWSLTQAGVVIAVGAISRILVQQTILRVGLWTSALFSAIHMTCAILAIIFTEQEWVILLEAVCAAMLDVTVAVEGLAFDQWSDSELMVSQAQSTVLAMFTIACALAATIGGIVFDVAGWKGVTFCHAGCCTLQLLCIISQPTTWRSLKETFYGRGEDDSDAELESVVPGSGSTKKPEEVEALGTVQEETELADEQAEDQPTLEKPDRGSVAFAEEAVVEEATPELPGAVQDEEQAEDPEGQKKKPHKSHGNRGSINSARSASSAPRKSATSSGSSGSRSWQLASRISHHTNRQSVVSGKSGHLRGRPSSKSRLSAGTFNTKGSGRSQSTNKTGRTNKTMGTVMSKLSAFTNGENFEHHYALRNALLPQVASRNAQVQLQEADENEIPSPSRRTEKKAKATLPRDVYIPAALLMLASFCNNLSYAMEWTVYAVYFREQHNWQSATWAGVAQTVGDLLAAISMSIFKGGQRPDLDDYEGIRRYWMAIRAQPYNMSCLLFWWIILTAAIMAPNLVVAVAAQVFMGTVYVFFAKTLTDLNLFFSLGESEIFMKLQVQCRNADSIAVLIASSCGLTMYENFFPESPFLLAFGIACIAFFLFTVGFCHRLGFGVDIETAEERRARRKGLRRVSSWKSVVKKSQIENDEPACHD